MPAFVVSFGARRARRYLAQAESPVSGADHRPFTWTPDLAQAEKFASAAQARTSTQDALGHSLFDVTLAPASSLSTDGRGG